MQDSGGAPETAPDNEERSTWVGSNIGQRGATFTIWCSPEHAPRPDHPTVLWSGFGQTKPGGKDCYSIPSLVTQDQARLRSLLVKALSPLEFSIKHSESKTESGSGSEIHRLFWSMSLPSAFPLLAGSIAYELARTRALLDLLDQRKPDAVVIVQPPKELLKVVSDWCVKNSSPLLVESAISQPKSFEKGGTTSKWKTVIPGVMKAFLILAKHAALSLAITRRVQKHRFKNVANVFVGYIDAQDVRAPSEIRDSRWGPLIGAVDGLNRPSVFLHIDHMSQNRRQRNEARRLLSAESVRLQHTQHHLVDDFLSPVGIVRAINWYCAIRKSARVIKDVAVRNISSEMGFDTAWILSPSVKDAVYGSTAMRNALWLSTFDEVARYMNPQKVFYFMENQAWEKALLRSMGSEVKSYGFVHSSVRFWDLKFFFPLADGGPARLFPSPKKILVGSSADRQTLISGGIGKELLREVEALRYLYLLRPSGPTRAVPESCGAEEILIVGDYDTFYQQQQIALANTIHSAMGGRTGLKVRFRPHPSRRRQLTNLSAGVLISRGRSIQEDLEDASVIICSHLSSATIDAEASGKPTIIVPDPRFFVDGLIGSANRIVCSSVEEMLPLLNSLLTRSERVYKKSVPKGLFLDNSLPRWQALLFEDSAQKLT